MFILSDDYMSKSPFEKFYIENLGQVMFAAGKNFSFVLSRQYNRWFAYPESILIFFGHKTCTK